MFERIPWPTLYARIAHTWKQGEHFIVIAPTGRGKTVLIKALLPLRKAVIFFGTKIRDEEYTGIMKDYRFTRVVKWPPAPWLERVMLWPKPYRTIRETVAEQKRVFRDALDALYRKGKWTAVFDELHWTSNDLGLYSEIASLHHQGRSSKLTFVDGFQRPAFVPRIVYSSATHLAVWGTNDPNDLKQLAAFTGIPVKVWLEVMPTLGMHEFIYINVRDPKGVPVISQVMR